MSKLLKRSIDKAEINTLPVVAFGGRIVTIITEEEADEAVDFLLTQSMVGVDTETRPSFVSGKNYKVALLQVSTDDVCFLFRLNCIGFPASVQRFLEDERVMKIGLSLKDDFGALRKRHDFKQGRFLELQLYVNEFGIDDLSLQKIYAILFGQRISKRQRLTNWEAETLSDKQKLYAATDAWACLMIYNYVKLLKRTGDYQLEERKIEIITATDEQVASDEDHGTEEDIS